MACLTKPALLAVNTATQSLSAGQTITYATNYIGPSPCIAHAPGSGVVALSSVGLYSLAFNADVTPTATGNITVAIYSNGTIIPGAQTTVTGTAAEPIHISLATLIKVLKSCACINNTANIQVQVSADATVTNAGIAIIKEA